LVVELGQNIEGHYMEGSSLVTYLQASDYCWVQAKLLGMCVLTLMSLFC